MRFSALLASSIPLLFSTAVATQTGERQCISNFGCVTALYDSDTQNLNYTMEMSADHAGWFSIGDSTKMKGSNMMVSPRFLIHPRHPSSSPAQINCTELSSFLYLSDRMGRQWEGCY